MISTDLLLREQIAIKLYEQECAEDQTTPISWDRILRSDREKYRRRAGDMAREISVA